MERFEMLQLKWTRFIFGRAKLNAYSSVCSAQSDWAHLAGWLARLFDVSIHLFDIYTKQFVCVRGVRARDCLSVWCHHSSESNTMDIRNGYRDDLEAFSQRLSPPLGTAFKLRFLSVLSEHILQQRHFTKMLYKYTHSPKHLVCSVPSAAHYCFAGLSIKGLIKYSVFDSEQRHRIDGRNSFKIPFPAEHTAAQI